MGIKGMHQLQGMQCFMQHGGSAYGTDHVLQLLSSSFADPTARKVMYNLPVEDLHAPVLGK